MGIFIEVIRKICFVFTILTTICFSYQMFYLFIPFLPHRKKHEPEKPNRYAVLIAARNEEAVIGHLLDSIAKQDYPAERITVFVVADNCTDNTAEIARAHGAEVFVRFSTERVGKGYALHDLIEHIRQCGALDNFDAFLIFDADNLLKSDYISKMNKTVSDGFAAFCGYRNTKNFGDSWISAGYGIWYLHDSVQLNGSRMRLGTSCGVSGTGFGFTRALLEQLGGWNFFTLTEDIEFNTWCATHGVRIAYCPDAMVYDEQVNTWGASWRQRTRWSQGGIQVSTKYAKDYARGICKGGRTAYSSFEFATLSMWGTTLGCAAAIFALLLTILTNRTCPDRLASALLVAFATSYAVMFLMGFLTMVTEWKRVRSTPWKKIKAMLTFPFFMYSFGPIALCAVFSKFEWKPVAHTDAISAEELERR